MGHESFADKKDVLEETQRNAALALLLFVFVAGRASAQGEAEISGVVTDAGEGVIPGAAVKVESTDTGAVRELVTDEKGGMTRLCLPIGDYE